MDNNVELMSPALTFQSEHYPASWQNKVPKRVRMAKTVLPDFPFNLTWPESLCCNANSEYDVIVNSHGAITAILSEDKRLGLKPYEFEVVEWHGFQPIGTEKDSVPMRR